MQELVRHTPTYTPPVASRTFAYVGIAAWESVVAAGGGATLSGQLNAMPAMPAPRPGVDLAVVLNSALAVLVGEFFANTGPTGQRSLSRATERMAARVAEGTDPVTHDDSRALGRAIAAAISGWAATDGGQVTENMGFPLSYALGTRPGAWVPTSPIRQQQVPLLPHWGQVRTFALPDGTTCGLPPPPAYSEAPGSAFHALAQAVYDTSRTLTDDQRLIARFWSDDPMLSPTPPGHWISIALQIAARDGLPVARTAEVLARLGITMADAFIACWQSKYEFDLLRPVTYIRKLIDPAWTPLLITPPFPEYPSGHSTQSGAAAAVLTALFGDGFAFDDATHADDGLPVRNFPSFAAAASEAGMSRFYGGIHFMPAVTRGLEQGACVGAHATALRLS
jgi:membrane-associated phospholipid phosphatase